MSCWSGVHAAALINGPSSVSHEEEGSGLPDDHAGGDDGGACLCQLRLRGTRQSCASWCGRGGCIAVWGRWVHRGKVGDNTSSQDLPQRTGRHFASMTPIQSLRCLCSLSGLHPAPCNACAPGPLLTAHTNPAPPTTVDTAPQAPPTWRPAGSSTFPKSMTVYAISPRDVLICCSMFRF